MQLLKCNKCNWCVFEEDNFAVKPICPDCRNKSLVLIYNLCVQCRSELDLSSEPFDGLCECGANLNR